MILTRYHARQLTAAAKVCACGKPKRAESQRCLRCFLRWQDERIAMGVHHLKVVNV